MPVLVEFSRILTEFSSNIEFQLFLYIFSGVKLYSLVNLALTELSFETRSCMQARTVHSTILSCVTVQCPSVSLLGNE